MYFHQHRHEANRLANVYADGPLNYVTLLMSSELCFKSAVELTTLIRNREVSAEQLLVDHLEHIEKINPSVNAIVTLAPEHATALARQVDNKISRGDDPGLLAGLPVAHKDLVNTRGIRTTFGSRIFANNMPTEDALIVKHIVGAGAVTLGKTNTPEWGAGSQTFNEVFGATLNPWDTSKTCGGSSGGAAVALASRMVPIADGSDLGGSLRNPANFCNVVGFRTSAGTVPNPSPNGYFSLPILGPMARNVGDCALLLDAISPTVARLPLSHPSAEFHTHLQRDFKGVRIALCTDFLGQIPVDAEVQAVVGNSATVFRDLGCEIETACPDFSEADHVFKTFRAWSMANAQRDNLEKHRDLYKETVIWNAEQGMQLTAEDLYNADVDRTTLYRRVASFLEDYEFLVLPVSQVPPFDINTEYPTDIAGTPMDTYIDWMKSCYFISATGLPSISVPGGFTAGGLPVGIQIVGRNLADLSVLQLAYAFEQQTQLFRKLPGVVTNG
jgi:amidase